MTCLILIVVNCTQEDINDKNEVSEIELGSNDIMKIGKLKNYKHLNNFVQTKIIDYKNSEAYNRLNIEDNNGFTIIDNNIIEIIDENGKTYTLKIVKDNLIENSFSNLIINFNADNETYAYIINYYPDANYLTELADNPQAVFQGDFNMEAIDYDGSLDFLNANRINCITVTNTYCNWGGTQHSAGENCTPAYMYTQSQNICWDTVEYVSNPDNDADSPPNTSGSTSSESVGGSSNPIYVDDCDTTSSFGTDGVSEGGDCDEESENEDELDSMTRMLIESELDQILGAQDAYEYDPSLDSSETINFNSVEEFEDYLNAIEGSQAENSTSLLLLENIRQDDHDFSLDPIINIFLRVSIQMILPEEEEEGGCLEVQSVTSLLHGFTAMTEWEQLENDPLIDLNLDNDTITIEFQGKLDIGVKIQGWPFKITKIYNIIFWYHCSDSTMYQSALLGN